MEEFLNNYSKIYLNRAIDSYSLDIRNSKIKTFGNTGILRNQFECIDISDNHVSVLNSISNLDRLVTFIACNNKIKLIEQGFSSSLPNLESLILTNNELQDIDSIFAIFLLNNLKRLSLIDNPVSKLPNYRAIVIGMLPNLVYLDFQKINQKEKNNSTIFFQTNTTGKEILKKYSLMKRNYLLSDRKDEYITKNTFSDNILPYKNLNQTQLNKIKIAISSCSDLEKLVILENSLIHDKISLEVQEIIDKIN
ncbi:putative U2 small nuclear ribonucleoprotein A' [Cryptosporidium felis]|nr:putative U2 small nuclear ribonucleoprotein A' [Cryptosporidium felis]